MLPRIARSVYVSRSLRRFATKPPEKTTSISTVNTPTSFGAQTFRKVTAYPFTVEPRDAQYWMDSLPFLDSHPWLQALLILSTFPVLRLSLYKTVARYLKNKNRDSPLRVKAVYVPVWRVFAIVDFDGMIEDGREQPCSKSVTLSEVYMPGNHASEFASEVHWAFDKIEDMETVPIGECTKPFGMEAECLPFTISPFSPFDLAKKLGTRPLPVFKENYMVYPQTVSPFFYAAFPVMVPVYTAEYDWSIQGDRKKEIFVCEAFGTGPRVANMFARRPDDVEVENQDDGIKFLWDRTLMTHAKKLAEMPPLQSDDDSCIRPLKREEIEPILRFIKVKGNASAWAKHVDDAETLPQSRQDAFYAEYAARLERLKAYIPSWWPQSKLAPASVKKAPSIPKSKTRPSKSRSSPI